MSDKTAISWTDATWNPMTGCTRVSPACEHCYIDWAPPMRIAGRHFVDACAACDGAGTTSDGPCAACGESGSVRSNSIGATMPVLLHPERLDQPLRWQRPRKVFVNSLSDLFHEDVPDDYIADVFAVMTVARQHTFQVLTKRHARMRSLLTTDAFWETVLNKSAEVADKHNRVDDWADARHGVHAHALTNVWLGVTVENQKWADLRVPFLLATPAAKRFLSCEPLLGAVNLCKCNIEPPRLDPTCPLHGAVPLNWVIAGGESGKDARPMHPAWVKSLRDQCRPSGIPFWMKQWGEWAPPFDVALYKDAEPPRGGRRPIYVDFDGNQRNANELSNVRGAGGWAAMARVGKRNAGHLLDGRECQEFPKDSA